MTRQETSSVFHYTTASAGLQIIESRRFRLSRFDNVNDLREARPAYPTITGSVPTDSGDPMRLWALLDQYLRTTVRIGCFTRDWSAPEAFDQSAGRGWGHPALWSHYGGEHHGVCLEFDRPRLIAAFSDQLSETGSLIVGDVTYNSHAFPSVPSVDYDHVVHFGPDAAAHAYLLDGRDYQLFTKHEDWSNEQEFRLVLLGESDQPVELDVSDCLTGVYFGESFPRQLAAEARRVIDLQPGLEARQLHYFNRYWYPHDGVPSSTSTPPGLPSAGEPLQPRATGTLLQRIRALQDAARIRDHDEAIARAELADVIAAFESALTTLTADLPAASSAAFQLWPGRTAIPEAARARAAGVEHDIVLEVGWSITASAPDHPGREYAASFALQRLRDSSTRLWRRVEASTDSAQGRITVLEVDLPMQHMLAGAPLDPDAVIEPLATAALAHLPAWVVSGRPSPGLEPEDGPPTPQQLRP